MKFLDYTTRDYQGFREAMLERAKQRLPEWTDHSPNDPGIVLIELLAEQLDQLSYYNDRVANEVFLPTATKRKSVINHCKLIGYELRWASAARHWQVFEFVPQPEDIVLHAGTLVGTEASDGEEPIVFELLEDLVIPAGKTGLEKDENGEYLYKVEVEHGETIEEEFVGTVSDSSPNQSFRLNYYPVLKESIRVFVDEPNGRREWQYVEDFISSDQDSHHYTLEVDEFGQVYVVFGTGTSGKIPTAPADIYVTYKVGGGLIGNVGAETITQLYDGIPGFVRTFNPYGPHVLGNDMESIEEAKINGPASLRRLDRYVTLSDYEYGILQDFPEVAKAKAINVEGNVDLYLMSVTGEPLTEEQKHRAMEIIESKKVLFTEVTLKDPDFVDIDIHVDINPEHNYDEEAIRYMASYVLQEIFNITEVDFGETVSLAYIFSNIMGIDGVKNARVITPAQDVVLEPYQIPRVGNITVTINGR